MYPVIDIFLEVQEQAFLLRAGMVQGLQYPAVLGQDVLILPELVLSSVPVSMIVTRAMAKQFAEEEVHEKARKCVRCCPIANVRSTPLLLREGLRHIGNEDVLNYRAQP